MYNEYVLIKLNFSYYIDANLAIKCNICTTASTKVNLESNRFQ